MLDPGPLVAAAILQAQVGGIIPIGLLAAIPIALIAGPLLARFTSRYVTSFNPSSFADIQQNGASPLAAAVALLFPVALIAVGAFLKTTMVAPTTGFASTMIAVSDPVPVLLLANFLAIAVLFP